MVVEETDQPLHTINWTEAVGALPAEWNHLVGYDPERKPENPAKTGELNIRPSTYR